MAFSARIPFGFVVFLSLIELWKSLQNVSLYRWGVFPRDIEGIPGIFFSPLIHSGWEHLVNNALPLMVLGTALMWFHRKRWLRIILVIWILEGLGVWTTGRPYFHVGASGLVYGLFSYLLVYGFTSGKREHLAAAIIAIFLYGSMIWGIFPIRPEHSWEGHFFGFFVGAAMAGYDYLEDKPKLKQEATPQPYEFNSQSDYPVPWEYSYKDEKEI